MRRALSLLTVSALVLLVAPSAPVGAKRARSSGAEDATVIAVVDFNFVPYHWDFLASKMPQATDSDRSNDLPLNRPPHEWLSGFPKPSKFKSYNRFDLTLNEKDPKTPIAPLDQADVAKWEKVKNSTFSDVNYYWMPGTKVIGAVEFSGATLHGTTSDHGTGVTSVSVGNLHGTCPECLLVFLNVDSGFPRTEANALRWAMAQPWIDVVTNSYGHGVAKVYNGPGVEASRVASDRGQTVFFSAGNGMENAYTAANSTYHSSEKGPDWIMTVGAISPGKNNHYEDSLRSSEHASYIGAGKPVDVAGIGLDYPSAYDTQTVSETGRFGFSGTSNASPTIAGTYARALYLARRDLKGPSRIQSGGVIATGKPYRCGAARSDCELRDGKLTAAELRTRLLHGAVHTSAGMTTYLGGQLPAVGEEEFMNEGHGSYFARETGTVGPWLKEFERIIGPLEGRAKALKRPEGERDWMTVDSWCRQGIWGAWQGGYYVDGKTDLPGPSPTSPLRSLLALSCPALLPPP